jgi:hypothetical protein
MTRQGPGRDVTTGHGRGAFRGRLEHFSLASRDGAARNQSVARNKFVVIVLGSLSALRAAGRIDQGAHIEVKKAHYQSSRARAADNQEAAHPVPGHVWVSGKDLVSLAPNPPASAMLRDLFAYCNHVPVLVNQADSLAEGAGMRRAFEAACQHVVRARPADEPFRIDDLVVQTAYRACWCEQAGAAYAGAIASLEAQYPALRSAGARQLPDGTIEPAAVRSEAEDAAGIKHDVLRIYLKDLAERPNRLQRHWLDQLMMALREGHFYPI